MTDDMALAAEIQKALAGVGFPEVGVKFKHEVAPGDFHGVAVEVKDSSGQIMRHGIEYRPDMDTSIIPGLFVEWAYEWQQPPA